MTEWSLWALTGGNSNADNGDPVSLGTKERTSTTVQLWCVGLRYYRGTLSAGTKTGKLFRTSGSVSVSEVVTFADSGTGWQEARFATPVQLDLDTFYTPTVFFPSGEPSYTGGYFSNFSVTNGPITAPSDADAGGQGVFSGGGTLTCPTNSFNQTCYWVDWIVTDVNPNTISPNGIPSAASVGQPAITPGPVTISPAGIASAAAVGQPTLTPGPATISPTGIASAATVGQPALTAGPVTINPAGIAPSSTVGQPALSAGPVTVAPHGIPSAATVGQPGITPGPVAIQPDGIPPTSSVGQPALAHGATTIVLDGIPSASSVGQPALTPGPVTIAPYGIAGTSSVGQPRISDPDAAIPRFGVGAPHTRWTVGPPRNG